METKKISLLPIFINVLIDMLGVGIVIPVLAHLFLDANGILPPSYELAKRTFLLGMLIASYPLAQFFGAPILGALSDKHGRKKILLISLFGTFLGYLLFAYGIITRNIFLLYASRILDGFTGGNISTIMSAIADVSTEKDKAKNFGMIGMAFGLGIILGPFIGGNLADPKIVSWFNHSTPFWFAALVCLFNFFLVIFNFKETLHTSIHTKVSLLTGMRNIKKAFGMKNLRTMFIVVFFITFGFNFYTQFFQVYLIEKFNYSQSQIGNLFAFMGVWIAITQGVLTRNLAKKYSSAHVLKGSVLMLSLTLPFFLLPNNSIYLYLIIPFVSIFNGITLPNINSVVSSLGSKESQGEILGINQSIQSLAMSIPPIISGLIVAFHRSLPVIAASISIFIAWLIYISFFKQEDKQVFKEV